MSEIYTDHAIINWVLEHCQILHLGINDGDSAYVVPVHFGYQEDTKGHYTIYILTFMEVTAAKRAIYWQNIRRLVLKPTMGPTI